MSLTSHLLFSLPTTLPKGKVRKHRMDSWWKSGTPESVFAREHCAAEKAANIEKVFTAVADGHNTAVAIADASGLSLATVQKALHELEDWIEGPRIVRIRGSVAHRFEVIKSERYAHLQIERQAEALARLGALHDEEMKKSAKSS